MLGSSNDRQSSGAANMAAVGHIDGARRLAGGRQCGLARRTVGPENAQRLSGDVGGVRRRADWQSADADDIRGAVAVAGHQVPGAGDVQDKGEFYSI